MNKHARVEGRIETIETIRGVAALLVCLYHFRLGNMDYSGSLSYFVKTFQIGWVGVEMFFVLSGFIIPWSLLQSNYDSSQFVRFFVKRCIRIEPAYFISILIVLLLGYFSTLVPMYKGAPFVINVAQVATHLAYLPVYFGYEWLSPVYWTLEVEFHYYILIGLFFSRLWKNQTSLLIGLVLGIGLGFVVPLKIFGYMHYFAIGIVTCALKTNKINFRFYLLSILVFVGLSIFKQEPMVMPIAGLGTSLAILYLRTGNSVSNFLGKISFSLYLLHVPIGGRIINLFGRFAHSELEAWAVILFALSISMGVAWLFFRCVDYPFQQFSKKIFYAKP